MLKSRLGGEQVVTFHCVGLDEKPWLHSIPAGVKSMRINKNVAAAFLIEDQMKLIVMAQNQRKGRNYSDSNKSSEQIFVFRLKAGKHRDGLGCN